MSDSVLLDTSFLISFSDSSRKNHAAARRYYRYFIENGVIMYLSSIVISEFHLRQKITDLPLDSFIILPFNATDAVSSAELDWTGSKGTNGVKRDSIKDDFKLLGLAKTNSISLIITDDATSLYAFCQKLKGEGKIYSRPVKLEDGFDESYVSDDGQGMLFSGSSIVPIVEEPHPPAVVLNPRPTA